MRNCNTILIQKQQKISALSPDKTDKYEYLTGEKILPSDQGRVIQEAKFTYSPLEKALENKQKQFKIEKESVENDMRTCDNIWKTETG